MVSVTLRHPPNYLRDLPKIDTLLMIVSSLETISSHIGQKAGKNAHVFSYFGMIQLWRKTAVLEQLVDRPVLKVRYSARFVARYPCKRYSCL